MTTERTQQGLDLRSNSERMIVLEVALILAAHIDEHLKSRELAERIVSLVKKRLEGK